MHWSGTERQDNIAQRQGQRRALVVGQAQAPSHEPDADEVHHQHGGRGGNAQPPQGFHSIPASRPPEKQRRGNYHESAGRGRTVGHQLVQAARAQVHGGSIGYGLKYGRVAEPAYDTAEDGCRH
ncbi:hypothetical protein [Alkalilimnicola sp. S0819]|uniref:hypothetical protein n=1 Tax=Alkalilimnicola sp. S0819 TaxID=2613922 RepID=UPI001262389A|nr:hypothetical protein [Alkalilimnicola sp. S0819]